MNISFSVKLLPVLKRAVTLAGVVAVGACSLLPAPEVETRYTLAPVGTGVSGSVAIQVDPSRTIRVNRPEVPVAFRGNQLVLIKNGQQTFYAAKAWDAPVADLLDAALARDLSAALPGWVVSGDTGGVHSAYELQTDVRTFATVQEGKTITVVMDMDLRLLSTADRQVLMLLPYSYRARLEELNTAQTVAAYNRGWQQLIARITAMLPQ